MNDDAFRAGRAIEGRGNAVLLPFLKERAHDGQLVVTSKGRLAPYLQEIVGDAMFNSDAKTMWTVEIKCEENNAHGNFFLETWSNRNLASRESHAYRGSNPGWLLKVRADLLFYYFLESDELYIIDFYKLKRWAFALQASSGHPNLDRYKEKQQGKRVQLNDTWGRCVPIADIQKEVGFRKVFPRQIELFNEAAA